jgi:hypothetical protein
VDVVPHKVPKPDPSHPDRRYLPTIKKIDITQVGNIRRDLIAWSDGTVSQVWSLEDKKVSLTVSNDDPKDIHLLRGKFRDNAIPKLLHFDADSVSWMTDNALDKGSQGGPTLHYQAIVVIGIAYGLPPPKALYQAWIDAKTLMPLKFDDGDALYSLTFSNTPPAGRLVLPSDMQGEMDLYEASNVPRARL